MDSINENTKQIHISLEKPQKKMNVNDNRSIKPKEHKKRIITETSKWNFSQDELLPETQFQYIEQINNNTNIDSLPCKFILQQIHQKIYGYKAQDKLKNKFIENQFVDMDKVIELMITCKNQCFYCKTNVHVLYEYVREPNQWSLERIDNNFGHNKNNVVIACLNCNLHRRTMYYERFLFTKQLQIVKSDT